MKKTFYIIGIIAFALTALAAIVNVWITFKYSPSKYLLEEKTNTYQISNKSQHEAVNDAHDPNQNQENTQNYREILNSSIDKERNISPAFYLCEISDFYENLIFILCSTIIILLGISFAYVYTTSHGKAEDLARQALKEESFKIILTNQIAKGANEFVERYSRIPELEQRIEFLEEQINKEGYELNDEGSDEVDNGNN